MKKITKNQESVIAYILGFLFAFSIAAMFVYLIVQDQVLDWRTNIEHRAVPKSYRLLDGRFVLEDQVALKPVAVILENHFESRPISGLEHASIIYETIVEGDITRFLAIFDSAFDVDKIGPVRSVRPFFVELCEEWNPVLFHAGGSQDGLYKLTYSPTYNVNEISGDGIYFWRDRDAEPPHNLYISSDNIKRALENKEINLQADFIAWKFKNDTPVKDESELVDIVEVNFSNNELYQVRFEYDSQANNYLRYLNNEVHKTEKGIYLKADNIIVQHVSSRIVDDYGRLYINLQSGGVIEVYRDGLKIEGTWKKTGYKTYYYDNDGQEIKFNRGVSWVELVFDK